jgi:hypothetical protein
MIPIAAMGLLTVVLSLIMIVNPKGWARAILAFAAWRWFHLFEITSRLALGLVLLYFADQTLYPTVMWILGGLFLFAGVFLIFMGSKRHRGFADRVAEYVWLYRPAGVAGLGFGLFVIYAALAG